MDSSHQDADQDATSSFEKSELVMDSPHQDADEDATISFEKGETEAADIVIVMDAGDVEVMEATPPPPVSRKIPNIYDSTNEHRHKISFDLRAYETRRHAGQNKVNSVIQHLNFQILKAASPPFFSRR